MRFNYLASALGLILIYFGIIILLPIVVAVFDQDYFSILPFISASIISIALSFGIRRLSPPPPGNYNDLKSREGLLIVALTWTVISIITGIPYLFYGLSPINALFEGISGITTTGATILTNFSQYPKAFFFWRSLSQWLGGMGIIVLFVAILPQLAVAGRQLFFAEAPGPTEEKITPRVRSTATALWSIYISLTLLQMLFLVLAGMPVFDAVCNSFSTLAAGGFSPNPQSIMGYNNSLIETIIIVFMFLAGANFALQFKVVTSRSFELLRKNAEFKLYFFIVFITSSILALVLGFMHHFSALDSIRHAFFQIISIITTTGFASQDFELWNIQTKILILLMMLIGGSAGSAGGGIKVVRILLGFKYMFREIPQTLHPRAVLPIKLDKRVVSQDILRQILAFILLYFTLSLISIVLISFIESDIMVGFTGTLATIGNIGPGFGQLGPMSSYDGLNFVTKIILSLNMLIGRLEIIPFLVMFHRDFWYFKR